MMRYLLGHIPATKNSNNNCRRTCKQWI